MLLNGVPLVHVRYVSEVVDEVWLPKEPDRERQVVAEVAETVQSGSTRELPDIVLRQPKKKMKICQRHECKG